MDRPAFKNHPPPIRTSPKKPIGTQFRYLFPSCLLLRKEQSLACSRKQVHGLKQKKPSSLTQQTVFDLVRLIPKPQMKPHLLKKNPNRQ